MANVQPRRNKDGIITSFSIKVHLGRDLDGRQKFVTDTYKVPSGMSERTARKKALDYGATFEKEVREGLISNGKQRFDTYCEYVLDLKKQMNCKHSTLVRYRELTERIYNAIGHIKLNELTAHHLNVFYKDLMANGKNKVNGKKLSNKTIVEHHRLISTVLQQAYKERIINHNVAMQATPPKIEKKEANHYTIEELTAILQALETEPLMWHLLVKTLLTTGVRRGELLGLCWNDIDFEKSKARITKNVLYSADIGVYVDTPKTERSKRSISLPTEILKLLHAYQIEKRQLCFSIGVSFSTEHFIFSQPDGSPMHPDSIGTHFRRMQKRYELPHLNAHAFRHTMASILAQKGQDVVSISNRLGHAQVSTTMNIYAHAFENTDKQNADILGDIIEKRA